MVAANELVDLLRAISDGRTDGAARIVADHPELATARLAKNDEQFLDGCRIHVYAGDTALHVAAASYDTTIGSDLVAAGADVRARNRRGAEPLHAATSGGPGFDRWDPERQAAMIRWLVGIGADPNAAAKGGVTPLHRAVRNRCSAAVATLLDAGADVHRVNDGGSSAMDLTQWTTGRPASGSEEARREQQAIVRLLEAHRG